MSQLRSDILHKRKQVEIEKSENLYKRNHITIPIRTSDSKNSDDKIMNNIKHYAAISD